MAIAAALVPPICALGLDLALGDLRLAAGAGLLFATNFVAIAVVGAGVFFWLGLRPRPLPHRKYRLRHTLLVAGMMLVLPVLTVLLNFGRQPSEARISESRLRAAFAPADVTSIEITEHDPLLVLVTVRTSTQGLPSGAMNLAQVILSEDFDEPVRLRVVLQRVIDGPPSVEDR